MCKLVFKIYKSFEEGDYVQLLIINNANWNSDAGDITLMYRRALAMQQKGVETTFLSVINRDINQLYATHNNINIINTDPSNRMNDIINYIQKNKPDVICFYGNKTLFYFHKVINFLKNDNTYNPKIYIDMQGAIEEEIEFKKGINYLKSFPKYLFKKKIYKYCLSKCNGVFTVTDEMYKYCVNLSKSNLNNIKIRCGINSVIKTEQKLKYRNEIRKKYNISDNKLVLCFSGYRSAWQKIDETIEFFKELDKNYEELYFAFFCNIDKDFLELLEQSFPKKNYIVKFLNKADYNKYLCACDVGFLLRDKKITNQVAFPNKFSDYLNAGLLCCISPYISEPISILEKYNLIHLNNSENKEEFLNKIKFRNENLTEYYKDTEKVCQEELLLTNQISRIFFDESRVIF